MPETRNHVALRRAAEQERQQLETLRERLVERARALEDELGALRGERVEVDERIRLLDALLEHPGSGDAPNSKRLPPRVLRGAELRQQATRVLAARAGPRTAVAYKDWFRWVQDAGFVVLGKRPQATFLSAIRRSPVVQSGDEPGTYWLDPGAPERLAFELSELQGELNDLDGVLHGKSDADRSHLVAYRIRLLANVRRVKRQLAEADSVLATPRSISAARSSRDVA